MANVEVKKTSPAKTVDIKNTKKATKKRSTASRAKTKKRSSKPATEQRQRPQYDLAPGTTLTRTFKGEELNVRITDDGFEYKGETFKSISAVARHICGYQISGPVFFGLTEQKPAAKGKGKKATS